MLFSARSCCSSICSGRLHLLAGLPCLFLSLWSASSDTRGPSVVQPGGKVALEDIPVFGVCRPACHDSSLYLFVLVLFLEAVVLSQVGLYVAFSMFYLHIVHVYRDVVYNHHLCLCGVHLETHSPTFIG